MYASIHPGFISAVSICCGTSTTAAAEQSHIYSKAEDAATLSVNYELNHVMT